MFQIGFSELMLVLLIAFVIVGPKDLPKSSPMVGKGREEAPAHDGGFEIGNGPGRAGK